jgi:phage terminase large subunit
LIIDLNKCWPQAADGSHSALPKQQLFLDKILDPNGPKFVRYVGGIGSGKSVSGCIAVLSCAVLYPGDYFIGRQFMPELRDTTYKTFLDICPKELVLEHRVAEATVRIKCANGGFSNVMFRGLEEPDKHRSLNLNAFYIDEANQVSEEAFLLLQGRLRGRHVRKGFLTMNTGGHDWSWRYFVSKQEFTNDWIKEQFFNIKAPSTENVHLPNGYVESMMASWSEDRIKREILADEDSFEGQVYSEFRRDIHVVKPFRIPTNWNRHIRIDHGYRNPAAVLYFAVNGEGEVFLYREFYKREWLIKELFDGKKEGVNFTAGIKALARLGHEDAERFVDAKIDPSTKNRSGVDGTSPYDEYYRCWPNQWPILGFAKNDVQVGIERVKQYLKPHPKTGRPLLYIFESCKETLDEISTYRYPELKTGESDKRAEPEKPRKVHDHAMDALRYMIVDLPDPTAPPPEAEKTKANTLERKLAMELHAIKNPPQRDPWRDT